MKDYNHIPASGFKSLNPEHMKQTGIMTFIARDEISLSLFSIWQIIAGGLGYTEVKDIRPSIKPQDIVPAMSRLFLTVMNIDPDHRELPVKIRVTREEVEIFLALLKLRMAHCEEERDSRSDKFNPDTYIGQKLLLIDLREWLMVESIVLSEAKTRHDVGRDE